MRWIELVRRGGAGLLVGMIRGIVLDLIFQFVATLAARLPLWLAEEGLTLGIGTPVVVGQVAVLVAKWADKIQGFIRALLNSLRRLNGKLNDLTEVIERLKQALRRISRSNPATSKPSSPDFFSKSPVRSNQDILDNGPGTPMTLDNGDFVGIPHLRDDASGQPIHILGVDHPTPRTQRTGETILVVGRSDADYVKVGRLWTAE